MAANIYAFLEGIGFFHPLHPMTTHIPIGMVIGCFFFGFFAMLQRKPTLRTTALHCSILALLFSILTIVSGLMDWQHRWGAELQPFIKIKMGLASALVILLLLSLLMNINNAEEKKLFFVYFLCLVCVTGLGYLGGELVWGV